MSEDPPVVKRDLKQPDGLSQDQIMDQAKAAKPLLDEKAEDIVKGLKEKNPGLFEDAYYGPGELKKSYRIESKMNGDYGGDYRSVLDYARGRIVVSTPEEVLAAQSYIQSLHDLGAIKIVGNKDQFVKPTSTHFRAGNYSLEMNNGHIVELRLEHKGMLDAADVTHAPYERYQELSRQTVLSGAPLEGAELTEYNQLMHSVREIHNTAATQGGLNDLLSEQAKATMVKQHPPFAEQLKSSGTGLTPAETSPSFSLAPQAETGFVAVPGQGGQPMLVPQNSPLAAEASAAAPAAAASASEGGVARGLSAGGKATVLGLGLVVGVETYRAFGMHQHGATAGEIGTQIKKDVTPDFVTYAQKGNYKEAGTDFTATLATATVGAEAGAEAGLLCGPLAEVCVPVGIVVGGGLGAAGAGPTVKKGLDATVDAAGKATHWTAQKIEQAGEWTGDHLLATRDGVAHAAEATVEKAGQAADWAGDALLSMREKYDSLMGTNVVGKVSNTTPAANDLAQAVHHVSQTAAPRR